MIKPRLVVIIGSLVLAMLVAVTGGSIAGAYWLTLHEVHLQHDAQVALYHRQMAAQEAAQRKQSEAICLALVGLDDARIGAQFASPSRTGVPLTESYGYRLARHIHAVVKATQCRALLAGKLPRT